MFKIERIWTADGRPPPVDKLRACGLLITLPFGNVVKITWNA